jgi:recombination protein RecR
MNTASPLEQLISLFAKLPGLGPRSARRAVLYLIRHREKLMAPLIASLTHTSESIRTCSTCGNLEITDPCQICTDPKRDPSQICVVEEIADLWALERSRTFRGRYHVLGGTLSALDGRGPDQLNIDSLVARANSPEITEVILATNATVEGQTTAHYISDRLVGCEVNISRLAHGIPMGGELDYLDDGTLGAALKARLPVS